MFKYMMMFYFAFGSIIHSNKNGFDCVCLYSLLLKESNLITCLDLFFNYKLAHRLLMKHIF
jgi:hypothetical protein